MAEAARDYSLTGPEAAAAISDGLADAEWYRSPIDTDRLAELNQRTNARAAIDVLAWVGLLVGFGVWAFAAWGSWWVVPAFVVYGALYGGAADARWHECGHGTAFRAEWLNTVVYYPASFMLLREPTVWRWSHIRHHSDTIIVGRDNEIVLPRPINIRAWLLNLLGLLGVPALVRRIGRHARGQLDPDVAGYVPPSLHRRVVVEARVYVAALLGVVVACIATRSILPALFIGLPTFYGQWLMAFFGTTQHAGLRENVLDHRLNTRTVRMNPAFRFLYLNMNYHVEHHMFPTVPYRHLPALHGEIRDDLLPPVPSTWAAYREIWTAARGQRLDPGFELDRVVPEAASTDGAAGDLTVASDGWIDVCGSDELVVGSLLAVEYDGQAYVACRAGDGIARVLDGVCTHSRRALLGEGALVGDEIECPKHNGRFRVTDGEATRAPAETAVQVYSSREVDGRIAFRV